MRYEIKSFLYKLVLPVVAFYGGARDALAVESCPPGVICIPPIIKATTTDELIRNIVNFLIPFAGSILVVIILVGAFQIMTSSGNPENIKKGRSTIVWALIGFAVILLAGGLGSIVAGILGETFGGTSVATSTVNTPGGVIGVIDKIAFWMFNILMALGTVFILFSAFLFLTSGGDTEKVSTARRALVYAIVALVIGVLAGGAKFLVMDALFVSTCPDVTGYPCRESCLLANEVEDECCDALAICPPGPIAL